MPNVIPFGLGRHTTSLVVTMQSVTGATGALADSTPVASLITSTGTINTDLVHTAQLSDDIQWTIRNNHEAIQAITRNRINNVPTIISGAFTLAEIVRKGSGEARLAACWFSGPSRYAKIEWAFGGAKQVVYARMRAFRARPNRTKNVDVAEFVLIDANTAPTYAAGMR